MGDEQLENDRLQSISLDVDHTAGIAGRVMHYACELALRWIPNGSRVLEFGPAEGLMTDVLTSRGYEVSVVEGSQYYASGIRERNRGVTVHESLFEEFETDEKYDFILASHVLEHVIHPKKLIEKFAKVLRPGGRVFAAVPNSHSLHRQAAVLMGLLPAENALNETDHQIGHRRVYASGDLLREFSQASWTVLASGGYWLKPLANSQIEGSWSPSLVSTFCLLGERYPDIAGEIYLVVESKSSEG